MSEDEWVQKLWERSHEMGSPHYHLRTRLFQRLIPPDGSGKRALDAGCSTGGATRLLLERGYEVHGVDLSSYSIARIQQTLPIDQRSRFLGIVQNLLEFQANVFYNLIVLSEVLEHVENDLSLLQRVQAWLAPRGHVVITVPADPRLWSDADVFSHHYRRYTSEQLLSLIRKAGLRTEVYWPYGFPILWVYTYLRNRWVRIGTLDRMMDSSKGGLLEGGIRTAATLLKGLVNVDRLFVGYGRPVGLIVLATRD